MKQRKCPPTCVFVPSRCFIQKHSLIDTQLRQCKPAKAISIIEADVNVDFAPPKDYKARGSNREHRYACGRAWVRTCACEGGCGRAFGPADVVRRVFVCVCGFDSRSIEGAI